MRGIAGYLVSAVVLAAVGVACLAARELDRDIVRVQQDFATLKYDEPEATFDEAERYFEYGSRLPFVWNGPLNAVRARKAALHYWQHQYDTIVPQQSDPVAAIPADNIGLQLIVANALFRTGMAKATDKGSTLEALNEGISGYLTVLKNTPRQDDAAHNYEYLVRLRDEVERGRKVAEPPLNSPAGVAGAPPPTDRELSNFKIYIPLESDERQDGLAGKSGPAKRKG